LGKLIQEDIRRAEECDFWVDWPSFNEASSSDIAFTEIFDSLEDTVHFVFVNY
jgi:hypothetical protein